MPNLFINMLREWYEAKELKYIDITEISKLDSSNIEYNIIYQAFFSSKNYEFMTFNIYLTESLFVGIAIENYSRIANRIGVNSPFKERVAGGWEPPADGIDKRPDYSHFFKSIEEYELVIWRLLHSLVLLWDYITIHKKVKLKKIDHR
jgi:hypothetical protein